MVTKYANYANYQDFYSLLQTVISLLTQLTSALWNFFQSLNDHISNSIQSPQSIFCESEKGEEFTLTHSKLDSQAVFTSNGNSVCYCRRDGSSSATQWNEWQSEHRRA